MPAMLFVHARAAENWSFTVDPGIKARPSVLAENTHTSETLYCFITKLEPTTSRVLERKTFETTNSVLVTVPKVAADTFVEMRFTTDTAEEKPLFKWRTLARPTTAPLAGYTGRREMLPPADFDAYWTRAKQQLAAVALKPKIEPVPDKNTTTGLLFQVELPSVHETYIVCWYYVPRDALTSEGKALKKYPAILMAPGYGGEQPPVDRTAEGYITLSVNPRNHGPSRKFWKSPVQHLMYKITKPEQFYYRSAFLDCLRGAQFLFSRGEVDPKKVATEGSSQGGLFAIATAALEPRIACVCSNVTAFSDYPDAMILAQTGHHTQYAQLLGESQSTASLIRKSLAYVDGANMATRVKCPVQINMAALDPVSPYVCGIVVHNRLPKGTSRELNIIPDAKHEVTESMREHNRRWLQKWLR